MRFGRKKKEEPTDSFVPEIEALDKVVGVAGQWKGELGVATKDEWDWNGTRCVEIRWKEDGSVTTIASDMVVKRA